MPFSTSLLPKLFRMPLTDKKLCSIVVSSLYRVVAQLLLQQVNTERQLKNAIRQYLTTMETSMKSYYAAKDAVASAQKGYDIVAASYAVGRSKLIELNDAQLALTQSQLAESQAIYNFVTAKSQLEQTLGQDFTK